MAYAIAIDDDDIMDTLNLLAEGIDCLEENLSYDKESMSEDEIEVQEARYVIATMLVNSIRRQVI